MVFADTIKLLTKKSKDTRVAPIAWNAQARLAQSAERKAFNFVVVGSRPTVDILCFNCACAREQAIECLFAKRKQRTLKLMVPQCLERFKVFKKTLEYFQQLWEFK